MRSANILPEGGPTSYVPSVPSASTSYAHRDSIYEWQLVAQTASPPFDDAGITVTLLFILPSFEFPFYLAGFSLLLVVLSSQPLNALHC